MLTVILWNNLIFLKIKKQFRWQLMKFNRIVEKLKKERAITLAIETAEENNLRWNKDIEVIFAACCDNPALAPKLGGNNDNEQRVFSKQFYFLLLKKNVYFGMTKDCQKELPRNYLFFQPVFCHFDKEF